MEVFLVLLPFVLLGIGVVFVAFFGGPGAAREAYLTRGGRAFRVLIPLLYLALGVGVPAAVILSREEATGGTAKLREEKLSEAKPPGKFADADVERGKELFRQTCASCHSLEAVNARGLTGPDLDEIGEVTPDRILSAIRTGGTGQARMPKNLLRGQDAEDVAVYVSKVAGN